MSRSSVLAPGKAMLIGEYAVLDGGSAVVAAVDRYARATLGNSEAAASRFIREAMRQAEQALLSRGLRPSRRTPQVDTSSFIEGGRKLGVGSSAAATVSAVAALLGDAGVDIESEDGRLQIEALARAAHDAAQGVRGSGADVVAATFGGLSVMGARRARGVAELPVALHFVPTSRSVSTAALIARYREVGAAAAGAARELADAAEAFLAAWRDGDGRALLASVERACEGYERLGSVLGRVLITEEHAAIRRAARRAGGAAKPSGAGGGDLAVVFLPSQAAESTFASELPGHLHPLSMRVSRVGVHKVLERESNHA